MVYWWGGQGVVVMSGVTEGVLDALRCPQLPSERGGRRAFWRRWRRYPPDGRWGVIGGLAVIVCLLAWRWGDGPDVLSNWVASTARAALAWARSVR